MLPRSYPLFLEHTLFHLFHCRKTFMDHSGQSQSARLPLESKVHFIRVCTYAHELNLQTISLCLTFRKKRPKAIASRRSRSKKNGLVLYSVINSQGLRSEWELWLWPFLRFPIFFSWKSQNWLGQQSFWIDPGRSSFHLSKSNSFESHTSFFVKRNPESCKKFRIFFSKLLDGFFNFICVYLGKRLAKYIHV